jgi:CheY-like chemotaxis protein
MAGQDSAKASIFIVEDETMIRMMVVDMLEDLGYTVAAEAGELDAALALSATTNFDIAILDVNVNGRIILPVAEAIRARGLPVIFATGYGAHGLPDQFKDTPTLQKPFQMDILAKTIEDALGPKIV